MVLEAHTLYEPAVLAFQRAIRLDPKEIAWRYYLAIAIEDTSRPQDALAALSDAFRRAAQCSSRCWRKLMRVLRNSGRILEQPLL
jgi:cytochrome c-type biogenesis protein CcmH/NrfG